MEIMDFFKVLTSTFFLLLEKHLHFGSFEFAEVFLNW